MMKKDAKFEIIGHDKVEQKITPINSSILISPQKTKNKKKKSLDRKHKLQ
jgi:hypothetical protein